MNLNIARLLPLAALALLLAATRFQHFGSAVNLPDASLAVFFLLGLAAAWRWFPAYALAAAAIDYAAVTWGGVSDWCITPAYAFLLPTYAAMTAGGHWSRRFLVPRPASLMALALTAAATAVVAFAISNASFFFYSDYFAGLGFGEYLRRTAGYFPSYLVVTLGYIGAALAAAWLARSLRARRATGA